jgi:hypothetical protein
MIQTHSSNNHKLINFNIPHHLINSIDELVKFKRVSRTSLLIGLLERWMRSEINQMEKDNQFNHLIMDMNLRNNTSTTLSNSKNNDVDEDEDLLPSPLFSNDDFNWEDRFGDM